MSVMLPKGLRDYLSEAGCVEMPLGPIPSWMYKSWMYKNITDISIHPTVSCVKKLDV
jgi:hypothetical protein